MKQTYVTALLLWLMLAGVCRGQGQNRFGGTVQTSLVPCFNCNPHFALALGLQYQRYLNKHWFLNTGINFNHVKTIACKIGPAVQICDIMPINNWYIQMPVSIGRLFPITPKLAIKGQLGFQPSILLSGKLAEYVWQNEFPLNPYAVVGIVGNINSYWQYEAQLFNQNLNQPALQLGAMRIF
ncbi:MAG: hypothetical protein KA783_10335 [Chitinophagales bacterium]|nr:hypothetical protein [Chitinophagales bacterium]